MKRKTSSRIAGRYDASGLAEAQFQPGSRGLVLRNLLGIKRKAAMDDAEAEALDRAEDSAIRTFGRGRRFTASDVCEIHRLWLGEIYPWAGQYRNINLIKGGFSFAAAACVPDLMAELERKALKEHTPCNFVSRHRVVRALAEVHVELLLIHPFREGNGRTARLLATLMALQADLPQLNFGSIEGKGRALYFKAVRAGMDRDYDPMGRIFGRLIEETFRIQSTS